MIKPRLSLITLGVASLPVSRAFYEGLGWHASRASQEGVAFFQLGAMVLSLYSRSLLAEDAAVANSPPGFAGMSLAQNYASPEEVDQAYQAAIDAGATPLKQPCPVFWGGYSGYFGDPDGFCWELAHNPFFPLDASGAVLLPE
jgi:uncharacterized glyoxalase superfamily protein PhnB